MSASSTAHTKIIALLNTVSPSPLFDNVYDTHQKANLVIPALSVEVESEVSIDDDKGLVSQQLVDNRLIRLSIKIHTSYRLGATETVKSMQIVDEVIRHLRENINLADNYWIFEVSGSVYNVEHTSSGTLGAEIVIDLHKVEFYEQ